MFRGIYTLTEKGEGRGKVTVDYYQLSHIPTVLYHTLSILCILLSLKSTSLLFCLAPYRWFGVPTRDNIYYFYPRQRDRERERERERVIERETERKVSVSAKIPLRLHSYLIWSWQRGRAIGIEEKQTSWRERGRAIGMEGEIDKSMDMIWLCSNPFIISLFRTYHIYLFIELDIYLYLSIFLSICLYIYISIYLSIYLSILLGIFIQMIKKIIKNFFF